MWRLCIDIVRLLRSWWQVDRPRCSPREGRLLRVAPPDIVRIGSQLVEITSRTVGEDRRGPYVAWGCSCGGRLGELRVELAGRRPVITFGWLPARLCTPIEAEDIEVFGHAWKPG